MITDIFNTDKKYMEARQILVAWQNSTMTQ